MLRTEGTMDRSANIGRDWKGLGRIAAILLILARLAGHAAAMPRPIRCAMLWGLRRADAVAKDFAARYAFWMGLPRRPVITAFDGDDRDAALSLALSLRVLASAIRDILVHLRRRQFLFGRRSAGGDDTCPSPLLRMAGMGIMSASVAASPDTS
jgi:hypothetical protein